MGAGTTVVPCFWEAMSASRAQGMARGGRGLDVRSATATFPTPAGGQNEGLSLAARKRAHESPGEASARAVHSDKGDVR
jgi:hypothetical protein